MTEVVNSFVVGHWAVARKMVDRHVSKHTSNVVTVASEVKQTNSQKKFMSTFYQRFLRKEISSLTLAVEMVKKMFLLCSNHNTPLKTVHLMPIL